jgi:hypothetical protein
MRRKIVNWAEPLHVHLRRKKVERFLRLARATGNQTLLDVGGSPGMSGEFLPIYSAFRMVVMLNLRPSVQLPAGLRVALVAADGCELPFEDSSFDWVFSNAVIEHVGGLDRQIAFASEIRRVARKGYFVTTPNKFFPIEPHTLFPLFQFMPKTWKQQVLDFCPRRPIDWDNIKLLSSYELRKMFPEGRIISSGAPLLPNSLVAFHRIQ